MNFQRIVSRVVDFSESSLWLLQQLPPVLWQPYAGPSLVPRLFGQPLFDLSMRGRSDSYIRGMFALPSRRLHTQEPFRRTAGVSIWRLTTYEWDVMRYLDATLSTGRTTMTRLPRIDHGEVCFVSKPNHSFYQSLESINHVALNYVRRMSRRR